MVLPTSHRSWSLETAQYSFCSQIAKITKIALAVLAISSLSFFMIPLTQAIIFTSVLTGAVALGALAVNVYSRPKLAPIQALWERLEQSTIKRMSFLTPIQVRHRFNGILCPKNTALMFSLGYLHANILGRGITDNQFIASQAPVLEDLARFWKAVFESSQTVVDLTNPKDQSHGGVVPYYPQNIGERIGFGLISIELTGIEGSLFTYRLIDTSSGQEKQIQRLHFASWPDFGVVSLTDLKTLVNTCERLRVGSDMPLWVHCRAGVGRTGTLITAMILKEKIQKGEISLRNLDESIISIVIKLRAQRGPCFVQQPQQLELVRCYALSLFMGNQS